MDGWRMAVLGGVKVENEVASSPPFLFSTLPLFRLMALIISHHHHNCLALPFFISVCHQPLIPPLFLWRSPRQSWHYGSLHLGWSIFSLCGKEVIILKKWKIIKMQTKLVCLVICRLLSLLCPGTNTCGIMYSGTACSLHLLESTNGQREVWCWEK